MDWESARKLWTEAKKRAPNECIDMSLGGHVLTYDAKAFASRTTGNSVDFIDTEVSSLSSRRKRYEVPAWMFPYLADTTMAFTYDGRLMVPSKDAVRRGFGDIFGMTGRCLSKNVDRLCRDRLLAACFKEAGPLTFCTEKNPQGGEILRSIRAAKQQGSELSAIDVARFAADKYPAADIRCSEREDGSFLLELALPPTRASSGLQGLLYFCDSSIGGTSVSVKYGVRDNESGAVFLLGQTNKSHRSTDRPGKVWMTAEKMIRSRTPQKGPGTVSVSKEEILAAVGSAFNKQKEKLLKQAFSEAPDGQPPLICAALHGDLFERKATARTTGYDGGKERYLFLLGKLLLEDNHD